MKEYKTVAGPKNISVGRHKTQAAFEIFADIINREAVDNWEYHSMETITITEKPGFLQQPVPMNYYMLIFVREKQDIFEEPAAPVQPAQEGQPAQPQA